jgi:hypothetical protein
MRILHTDLLIDLALSASSERSGFPATNVQHPHLTRTWRSVALTSQRLTFDAGGGLTIAPTLVVIAAHNLTSSATLSVEQNSTDAWGAPPVSVPAVIVDGLILVYLPGVAYQYLSILFNDATNPATYIEIGRVEGGVYWQSAEDIDRGTEDGVEDTTRVTESVTGQSFGDLGQQKQTYRVSFGIMQAETRVSLKAIYAAVGQHMPIILIPNENALDVLPPLYCRMTKSIQFTGAGGWLWQDDGLQFTEVF